jgi:hypothetical protein
MAAHSLGDVELVLLAQASPVCDLMRSLYSIECILMKLYFALYPIWQL